MTKEQETIERLNKLVKLRKNKAGEIKFDTCICGTEDIETILSVLKQKDKEIEHQKEKRNNQKAELAILNEKQKEMNKLINTVSSYKGMVKKLEKENMIKDKEIDLMAEELVKAHEYFYSEFDNFYKEYFIGYF